MKATTPHKPVSEYALRRVYGLVAPAVVEVINAGETAMPQLLVFADTGDEPVYITHAPPELVLMAHTNPRLKHQIPKMIDHCLRSGADIVVHVTESWLAPAGDPAVPDLVRAGVTVDKLPGARVVLFISMHTRDGGVGHAAMPIVTRADGKRHVDLMPLDTVTEMMGPTNAAGIEAAQKMEGKLQ